MGHGTRASMLQRTRICSDEQQQMLQPRARTRAQARTRASPAVERRQPRRRRAQQRDPLCRHAALVLGASKAKVPAATVQHAPNDRQRRLRVHVLFQHHKPRVLVVRAALPSRRRLAPAAGLLLRAWWRQGDSRRGAGRMRRGVPSAAASDGAQQACSSAALPAGVPRLRTSPPALLAWPLLTRRRDSSSAAQRQQPPSHAASQCLAAMKRHSARARTRDSTAPCPPGRRRAGPGRRCLPAARV